VFAIAFCSLVSTFNFTALNEYPLDGFEQTLRQTDQRKKSQNVIIHSSRYSGQKRHISFMPVTSFSTVS
jgi:hypothetical protein